MSEILRLIQEGDLAGLDLEQAREAVEQAKASWESAKARFDQSRSEFEAVIAKADEIGFPRAKLKKLIEERTAALWVSGLVAQAEEKQKLVKAPRAPRKKAETEAVLLDENFAETESSASMQ